MKSTSLLTMLLALAATATAGAQSSSARATAVGGLSAAPASGLEVPESGEESSLGINASLLRKQLEQRISSLGITSGGDLSTREDMQSSTFIGLALSPLSRDLTAQLPLAPHTGLLAAVVAKDSPAEKCGIQANDILVKLEDQILVNPQQFSVLIGNHKEGDTVKISLLRKGQPTDVSATLATRKADPSTAAAPATSGLASSGVDVLVDGKLQKPLRTYTRRLELSAPGPEAGATGRVVRKDLELRDGGTVYRFNPGKETSGPSAKDGATAELHFTDGEDVSVSLDELQKLTESLRKTVEALENKASPQK